MRLNRSTLRALLETTGRSRTTILALLLLSGLVATVFAQRPGIEKATLSLALDRTAYEAGATARLAAIVTVDENWHVQSHTPSFDYLIPTTLTVETPADWAEPVIEYPAHSLFTAEFEDEPLAVYEGEFHILATLEIPAAVANEVVPLSATLRYQACDDRQCVAPTEAVATLQLSLAPDGRETNSALFATVHDSRDEPAGRSAVSLVKILILGVLGGLILNAMPCVLPVLSLKLFGLLHQAAKGRRATTIGALATAAGIVVSFWSLALAALLARGAGQFVGWGVQFQSPAFVTFLTIVVVLFCLNLWSLFEIPLPRRFAALATGGSHEGLLGHFSTGLFATLMATPCSAPFLGTAVGFALSQSGGTIFLVFTAVGLGMALPYLIIAAAPRTMNWLPKPGPWMVQLKVVMGFLLAGAAVWLLYVLAAQMRTERLAFIEIGLLILALFVWMSQQASRSAFGRRVAVLGVLVSIGGTLFLSLGGQETLAVSDGGESTSRIQWSAFNRAEAEALAQEGRLVFVDVTADWCFTCKANERLVLETQEIAAAFEDHGVIAMKADWTNRSDEIARYLEHYGRYSVPFYLLHRPQREPYLFPELLRRKQLLAVLEESGSSRNAV